MNGCVRADTSSETLLPTPHVPTGRSLERVSLTLAEIRFRMKILISISKRYPMHILSSPSVFSVDDRHAGGRRPLVRRVKWIAVVCMVHGLLFSPRQPLALGVQEISAEQNEFFETRIRPVLIEQCYACHNSTETAEGGLALDDRSALRTGAESGPVLHFSHDGGSQGIDASRSRLMQVIRHEIEGLEMPDGGAKLDERVIGDFEQWLAMGAPDPRDEPPSSSELHQVTSWEAIREKRKQWWSFQPIGAPAIARPNTAVGTNVDQFIRRELSTQGLSPAGEASREILIRRLYFAMIGLPPSPEAVREFVADESEDAYEQLVDQLLESPHFGERWARHWMDWVRYAESHGSEGDPRLEGAEHYRDYLIRALNQDVPYDQLLKEHIAGDLLEHPRVNEQLAINESLIGTAHWRMVFHGFAPTDALDEKVRFTDDAINAFSKAFLGLTVSCARCHDHKFDAISQMDYYAVFGILASTRPGREVIELAERQNIHRDRLLGLKQEILRAVYDDWMTVLASRTAEELALGDGSSIWRLLGPAGGREIDDRNVGIDAFWRSLVERAKSFEKERAEFLAQAKVDAWDLTNAEEYAGWYRHGNGLPAAPTAAGEFAIAVDGERALQGIYPSGVYSHLVSEKHAARLESGAFPLQSNFVLWLNVAGDGKAMSRYVVQNYPRSGTVYPVSEMKGRAASEKGLWNWQAYDLSYWKGDSIHVELSTANDAPLLVKNQPRSWFGIRQAVLLNVDQPGPPPEDLQYLQPLIQAAEIALPATVQELTALVHGVVVEALHAWRVGTATDSQALLLDRCLAVDFLPNSLDDLPTAGRFVQEYRELENQIPSGTRVPTLGEWRGSDSPLLGRGDHKNPQQSVPRRFLEAIDATPYAASDSGRLRLAEDMLSEDNPFTARVIVNRIWHHLFGRGIVATTDNFGRLGELPTHPELLDYLADAFRTQQHWSMKELIRSLVTSQTWRQDSVPSEYAAEIDPDNKFLSHFSVQRLDAESLRDALLSVSGKLDLTEFGPAVSGESDRRSVYVKVIRNDMDAFLASFNAPVPFTTTGRRDVTNVPAQSLLLLNSPRVRQLAHEFAKRAAGASASSDSHEHEVGRMRTMWQLAFARPPSSEEVDAMRAFVDQLKGDYQRRAAQANERIRQIESVEAAMEDLLRPVRLQLEGHAAVGKATDLRPLVEWKMDAAEDPSQRIALQPKGTARFEAGGLILDGAGWAESGPIPARLAAKSLETLVVLENLNQRGGGVMTVQDLDGNIFDSIVFAEKKRQHWLAGSDHFHRTTEFNGTAETLSDPETVHLVMTYTEHGKVTCYRNGEEYGQPYQTALQVFPENSATVLLGMRHGKSASKGRMLVGRILEARLYDRALSRAEVAEASAHSLQRVTRSQLMGSLQPDQLERMNDLEERLRTLREQHSAIEGAPDPSEYWTDLGHSMFNMKEFIYVR